MSKTSGNQGGSLIVTNARIWTNDGQLIDNGYVKIEDNTISEVGPMPAPEASSTEDIFDAQGQLLMPGFVNAHTHLYSYLARGMAIDGVDPYSFYDILAQIWWRLDKALTPEANYYSGIVGASEMLKSGITTVIDHHASPNAIDGSLGQLKKAVVDDIGLRACFCYEITDRDGVERAEAGIAENISFWDEVNTQNDGKLGALIGLHASVTVSDRTFQKLFDAVGDRNLGYHIHVAEGQEDGVDADVNHGKRTVIRLKDLGILNPKTILAHCIHLNEPEKDVIAENDVIVSNQPQSNMNNAVGAADVSGLLKRGVMLGLGNDGFGSNLLDDLKTLYLVQKHENADPKVLDLGQAHQMMFQNNYAIAERLLGVKLGQIKPGYQADFILVNYDPPTPLHVDNMMGHLVFGLCSQIDVTTAFVAGRAVMQDRKILGVNTQDVYHQARQEAQQLWDRIE
jgi:putative selenium metabolism protein SsnA